MIPPNNLLTVEDLSIFIKGQTIIRDISFQISEGEKVALAGPSGSGKTLTAYSIASLLDKKFNIKARRLFLKDHSGDLINLLKMKASHYHQIGFVFQEPQVALNPLIPIGKQLKEGLENFFSTSEINDEVQAVLDELNLPKDNSFLEAFPHELSGGQQQRIVIGMAIAKNPRLLIADEPTTSLDPKTTVEILELIMKMVDQKKMSLLLITHDQKIIDKYCDRVLHYNLIPVKKFPVVPQSHVQPISSKSPILVELMDLNLHLSRRNKGRQTVLQNLTACIYKGEIIGLVGKSGSGKSSLSKVLSGLIKAKSGQVIINCQSHQIQLVQQDPLQSLNPMFSVEETIGEVIKHFHKDYSRDLLQSAISSLLIEVGLSDDYRKRKPVELSGGERQRVAIARSLAAEPELLICDESVSALDQTNQKMIINLLITLNRTRKMAILFVTHDLSLVDFCHSIWVLNRGILVEQMKNTSEELHLVSTAGLELLNYFNFFKK